MHNCLHKKCFYYSVLLFASQIYSRIPFNDQHLILLSPTETKPLPDKASHKSTRQNR